MPQYQCEPEPELKLVVIIGGGIIGCTTAYYISHHPSFTPSTTHITLLEASAHGAAQGASGKAGGLVARWAYPKALVDVSFDEHVRLARKHGGAERWGWRYVSCGAWTGRGDVVSKEEEEEGRDSGEGKGKERQVKRKSLEKTLGLEEHLDPQRAAPLRSRKKNRKTGLPDDLLWVSEDLTDSYEPMAGPGETAQVHPYQFTTSMLSLAQSRGSVDFVQGRATAILQSNRKITGVEYIPTVPVQSGTHTAGENTKQTIPATHIILAAGAWSPSLLPSLPITSTRAHSITIRPPPSTPIAPYVLFTSITFPSSPTNHRSFSKHATTTADPEIYPRPEGEIYACGPGDDAPLPATVDDVLVDAEACESVVAHVKGIFSRELREGTVERRQACFLPTVTEKAGRGGGPTLGAVEGVQGLVVAVGHTCWGICNAPGTARAISELVMDGEILCANLEMLDPSLFL